MFQEVVVEVALSRCRHLTDHTAVISALHLTGKGIVITNPLTGGPHASEIVSITFPQLKLAGQELATSLTWLKTGLHFFFLWVTS